MFRFGLPRLNFRPSLGSGLVPPPQPPPPPPPPRIKKSAGSFPEQRLEIELMYSPLLGKKKGTGAEMHPAIGSGIATGDASVSYWPIVFLTQVTVPEVFAKVNLRFLFVSKVEISKLSPTAMNCHEKKTLRHS